MEILRIEDVYARKLEFLLDDTSVINLIDDKTNVPTILGKVTYLVAFYHRNFGVLKELRPEYVRRFRIVERLFLAYQEGMLD
ncbi:MAG TPA: hypothetical protein HA362_03385 [Nanoarchaeota archaeon]|nr:hypothetical protein [Nanoarchaeota archaeon]